MIAAGSLAALGWGSLRMTPGAPQVRTMGFGSLVTAQILHAITARSELHGLFSGGTEPALAPNRALTGSLLASAGLQALGLLVPGVRAALGVAPLGLADLAATAVAGVMLYSRMRRSRRAGTTGFRERGRVRGSGLGFGARRALLYVLVARSSWPGQKVLRLLSPSSAIRVRVSCTRRGRPSPRPWLSAAPTARDAGRHNGASNAARPLNAKPVASPLLYPCAISAPVFVLYVPARFIA